MVFFSVQWLDMFHFLLSNYQFLVVVNFHCHLAARMIRVEDRFKRYVLVYNLNHFWGQVVQHISLLLNSHEMTLSVSSEWRSLSSLVSWTWILRAEEWRLHAVLGEKFEVRILIHVLHSVTPHCPYLWLLLQNTGCRFKINSCFPFYVALCFLLYFPILITNGTRNSLWLRSPYSLLERKCWIRIKRDITCW